MKDWMVVPSRDSLVNYTNRFYYVIRMYTNDVITPFLNTNSDHYIQTTFHNFNRILLITCTTIILKEYVYYHENHINFQRSSRNKTFFQ